MLETPKILGVITGVLPASKDFYIFLKALLVLHLRRCCHFIIRFVAYHLAIIRRKNKTMTPAIKGSYLKQEILESKVLSIVTFESKWSGSCQIVAPILEELATKYEHTIFFYRIDIEEEKEITYEYGIMELPTILFFQNGEVIEHITGLTSKYTIQEKIENILFSSDYSKSFHNQ